MIVAYTEVFVVVVVVAVVVVVVLISTEVVVTALLVVTWLVPRKTCRLGARSVGCMYV